MSKLKKNPRIDIEGIASDVLDAALVSTSTYESLIHAVSNDKGFRRQLKIPQPKKMEKEDFLNAVSLNLKECYDLYNLLVNVWNATSKEGMSLLLSDLDEQSDKDGFFHRLEELINENEILIAELITFVRLNKKEWHDYLKEILERYVLGLYVETGIKLGDGFDVQIDYEELDKIDTWRETQQKLRDENEILQKEVSNLNKKIAEMVTKHKNDLAKKDKKITNLKQEKLQLSSEQKAILKDIKKQEKEREKQLNKSNKEAELLQLASKKINDDLEKAVQEISNLKTTIQKHESKIAEQKGEIASLEKAVTEYSAYCDSLEEDVYGNIADVSAQDEFSENQGSDDDEVESNVQDYPCEMDDDFYSEILATDGNGSGSRDELVKKSDLLNTIELLKIELKNELYDSLFFDLRSELSKSFGVEEESVTLEGELPKDSLEKVYSQEDLTLRANSSEHDEKPKIKKGNADKPLLFTRNLLGGEIKEIGASISENVVRKLNLNNGDLIIAKPNKSKENAFIYTVAERIDVEMPSEIVEIKLGRVEYIPRFGSFGISQTYNGETLEYDGERIELTINDHDIDSHDLRNGDVVDAAYLVNKENSLRIRFKYPYTLENTETIESKLARKVDRSKKIKEEPIAQVFEGKTILVNGLEPKHAIFRDEIEKRGGTFIGWSGDVPDKSFESKILKSDAVIMQKRHMSHGASKATVKVCKEAGIPFASTESFSANAVLAAAEELIYSNNVCNTEKG